VRVALYGSVRHLMEQELRHTTGRYRRVYVNDPITLLTSSTDVLVGHDDGVMREAATPITPVEALK